MTAVIQSPTTSHPHQHLFVLDGDVSHLRKTSWLERLFFIGWYNIAQTNRRGERASHAVRKNFLHFFTLTEVEGPDVATEKLERLWTAVTALAGPIAGLTFVVLTQRQADFAVDGPTLSAGTKKDMYVCFLIAAFSSSLVASGMAILFYSYISLLRPVAMVLEPAKPDQDQRHHHHSGAGEEPQNMNQAWTSAEMKRLQQLHIVRFISKFGLWFDGPVNLTVLAILAIEGAGIAFISGNYSSVIWWVSIVVCMVYTVITVVVASSMRSYFLEAMMECDEMGEREVMV